MPANIVVVGAGVAGLTTGLPLARDDKHDVTIVAKHMPGDYSIEYASPWAGANCLPFAKFGSASQTYEQETWPELARLASESPEAGIHFQDAILYRREKDFSIGEPHFLEDLMNQDPWFKTFMPKFRTLEGHELPNGVDSGTAFTSVCINPALYLPWLASQCLKSGVTIRRGTISHIVEAAALHHTGKPADAVVNCTGLSSRTLGGVGDKTLYPGRGQIVLVENDPGAMVTISGTDDASDELTYMMNRAGGGGCILGGCLQESNWDSQVDPNLATRIMQRCVRLRPQIVGHEEGIQGLRIVRHSVGLRPMRTDGPRVERDMLQHLPIIHNYGHGGYGYQTSYGTARRTQTLMKEVLASTPRL